MPSLASFWILALFQPAISDACHALIVLLDTIKSYGCNDRLEWAASSRQGDQQLKAVVISRVLDPDFLCAKNEPGDHIGRRTYPSPAMRSCRCRG